MADKVHCDLLEIFGPDWENITEEQVSCLVSSVHQATELFGSPPELYGFVGTQRIENIVGGYFVIQYEEDEYHYDKQKQLDIRRSTPFARMLFVLFPETGKVLLQNTRFVNITSLNMTVAYRFFREALDSVLSQCELHRTIDLYSSSTRHDDNDFLRAYQESRRVVRLQMTRIDGEKVPPNIEYYNPQREKNAIIRESHQHDYAHLKKVDLEAEEYSDLRDTHIGKDIIYSGRPELMTYFVELEEFIMRREVTNKFEFYIDMKAEVLPRSELQEIITRLRREHAVYLNNPTISTRSDGQLNLFTDIPSQTEVDEQGDD